MLRTKLQSDSMHVKVTITLFLRDKNMHTNKVSRTAKLTSFARLFLLFLSLQSYRTTGSIRVLREEGYFSCKAFKVLGRENPASRRNRVIFQECLVQKSSLACEWIFLRFMIFDARNFLNDWKNVAINEISQWTK